MKLGRDGDGQALSVVKVYRNSQPRKYFLKFLHVKIAIQFSTWWLYHSLGVYNALQIDSGISDMCEPFISELKYAYVAKTNAKIWNCWTRMYVCISVPQQGYTSCIPTAVH